jgi:protein farnesyltransferase/geranylgeranyltransferase type-1 subunit alpha
MSYLRAVMSTQEKTPRVIALTSHIISLNPAHYTVWLYRASTLFAINFPIKAELEWVNDIALDNQKNYQIWHHRQLLIDHLYLDIKDDEAKLKELEESERAFMTEMFDADAKNYHVWSYRQYLVRKLNLWNQAEIESIEVLLKNDVRNNSAWSHRFFVVFNDPKYCTEGSPATAHDPKIPDDILDREIEFAKAATFEAPQNQSPWNYLRGILCKGGRELTDLESFAAEFVKEGKDGAEEDVRSSHALDFLADIWAKTDVEKAKWALELLGNKYDRIRKGYWDWKIGQLTDEPVNKLEGNVEALKV